MVVWRYLPDVRVPKATALNMPKLKECLVCRGKLLRTAERTDAAPYQWIPNGYICSKCNTMFMGVA